MVIYDLGNIADWLSAIGTIGATIVALYLANREVKPRAKVTFKYSYLIDGMKNNVSYEPVFISVEIINLGAVPIYLKEYSILTNKNERLIFLDGSHNVNKLLNPGELYTHDLDYKHIKQYLLHNNIEELKTYVYFRDGSGRMYKRKIILRI